MDDFPQESAIIAEKGQVKIADTAQALDGVATVTGQLNSSATRCRPPVLIEGL